MHTRHVSPSQISTFAVAIDPNSACEKRWAFSRIRPRHETPATRFGTRFHAIEEAWFRDRIAPDPKEPEGRAALASLEHLPMPQTPGMEIERELHFLSDGVQCTEFEPIRVKGSRAMKYPHGEIPAGWVWYHMLADVMMWQETPPRVIDHKSTGRMRNADLKNLATDPQRIMYAFFMASKRPDAREVLAHWQYTQRDAKKSEARYFLESAQCIRAKFLDLHNRFGLQISASYGKPPSEFSANLYACSAFGGCPHRTECHEQVPNSGSKLISIATPERKKIMSTPPDLMAQIAAETAASESPAAVVKVWPDQTEIETQAFEAWETCKAGKMGKMDPAGFLAFLTRPDHPPGQYARIHAHLSGETSVAAPVVAAPALPAPVVAAPALPAPVVAAPPPPPATAAELATLPPGPAPTLSKTDSKKLALAIASSGVRTAEEAQVIYDWAVRAAFA